MKRTDIILLLNLSLIPLFAGCSQNNIYRSANNGSELTYPELTNEQNAIIAPGPPGNLWFSIESGNKIINWQGTRDDTVSYYTIYGRCDKNSSLKKISQIKFQILLLEFLKAFQKKVGVAEFQKGQLKNQELFPMKIKIVLI